MKWNDPSQTSAAEAPPRRGTSTVSYGRPQRILMPGVDLEMRDLSAEAPLVNVNGQWAWCNDAADFAVPLPNQQP
jgi:hypothetical protein